MQGSPKLPIVIAQTAIHTAAPWLQPRCHWLINHSSTAVIASQSGVTAGCVLEQKLQLIPDRPHAPFTQAAFNADGWRQMASGYRTDG